MFTTYIDPPRLIRPSNGRSLGYESCLGPQFTWDSDWADVIGAKKIKNLNK